MVNNAVDTASNIRVRFTLAFMPQITNYKHLDNLRKGAATNAVQIAEYLVAKHLIGQPVEA